MSIERLLESEKKIAGIATNSFSEEEVEEIYEEFRRATDQLAAAAHNRSDYIELLKNQYVAANLNGYRSELVSRIRAEFNRLTPDEEERNAFNAVVSTPEFVSCKLKWFAEKCDAFKQHDAEEMQREIDFLHKSALHFIEIEKNIRLKLLMLPAPSKNKRRPQKPEQILFSEYSELVQKVVGQKQYCAERIKFLQAKKTGTLPVEPNPPVVVNAQETAEVSNDEMVDISLADDPVPAVASLQENVEKVKVPLASRQEFTVLQRDLISGIVDRYVNELMSDLRSKEIIKDGVAETLEQQNHRKERLDSILNELEKVRPNGVFHDVQDLAGDHLAKAAKMQLQLQEKVTQSQKQPKKIVSKFSAVKQKPMSLKKAAYAVLTVFHIRPRFENAAQKYLHGIRRSWSGWFKPLKLMKNMWKFCEEMQLGCKEKDAAQRLNYMHDRMKICLSTLSDSGLLKLNSNLSREQCENLIAAAEFSRSYPAAALNDLPLRAFGDFYSVVAQFKQALADVIAERKLNYQDAVPQEFLSPRSRFNVRTAVAPSRLENRASPSNLKAIKEFLAFADERVKAGTSVRPNA